MTEELLAKWREAQDKLRQAKEALDGFQQFVVKFQEEQAKIAEKLQFPSVAGLDLSGRRVHAHTDSDQ